jgi:hypothetical protein
VGQALDAVGALRDDDEAVLAELERLRFTAGILGGAPSESVGAAPRRPPGLLEIPTRDVQDGFHVEIALPFPQLVEVDLSGVPEEPGCFMVERLEPLLELSDAKRDREASTLRSEAATGGNRTRGR